MNKHQKYLWRIFRTSIMKFFIYRSNFFYGVLASVVYGISAILLIWLIFQSGNVKQIAGFSIYEIYFVLGLSQIMVMIDSIVISFNTRNMRSMIHYGGLDKGLTMPINTVWWASFQYLRMRDIATIILYLVFLLFFVGPQVMIEWSWWSLGQFLYIIVLSLVLYWALYWITALIWFYWPQFNALRLMVRNVEEINKNPRELYPDSVQWVMTFIVPMFVIINPVYLWLTGEYTLAVMLRDAGVVIIFLLIYMIMWRDGLKRYNSAN